MTKTLIDLQIQIITYMAIGFILKKVNLIDSNNQSFLSDLALKVLLPISVFVSFINNLTIELISTLIGLFLVGVVMEIGIFLFTGKKFKNFTDGQMCVSRYGLLVANGGLIGTPVIEGILGPIGVMYCNVFLISQRILAYSAGESIFNPSKKKSIKDTIVNFLLNNVFLAMVIAIVFLAINIKIPSPIFTALSKTGASLTPICLILVGSMLAEKLDFNKQIFAKVCLINVLRLFIIPMISLAICLLLKFDIIETTVIVLLMGMPCGSTAAVFAKKYNGDTSFGSMVVFTSTILSTFTLVGVMRIIELFF